MSAMYKVKEFVSKFDGYSKYT